MNFNRKNYTDTELLDLYLSILKPRLIEEKMLTLLRQGKISKWFSGIGQEAIASGVTKALENDEWIFPLHRNLGVFVNRGMPLDRLFAQWQGKSLGYTKGRERSFHFGSREHHICGMISHLGAQLGVADGVALASNLGFKNKATLAFCGDGSTSEGDFHEAVNLAAVWNLPVIFVIENNGYGLSTPNSEQFKCNSLIDKAPGYGIDALQVDGNNILEVFDTIRQLAKSVRANPRPVMVEALTFRMRGHEEASGTKYIPQELLDKWAKKDPIENYERYLVQEHVITEREIFEQKRNIDSEIDEMVEKALQEPMPEVNTVVEVNDIYAPYFYKSIEPSSSRQSEKRMVDAIKDALQISLDSHQNLILMGQDIAEYGGVFKVTEGLVDEFGKSRIRNTPLCESAVLGASLGLSIAGYKSVVEMQFADFVTCGFNQIVNNIAKSHYRWGQNADVVIRLPTGAGVGAGPFHSQSTEAWFFHVPGLKIVYPSTVFDAKGLLIESINDPNPVLYFEHKALYRSIKESIPNEAYTVEIGKAAIRKSGNDATIIGYGQAIIWAEEIVAEMNYDVEIIDLVTLLPWDKATCEASVNKTGKALLVTEDNITGSIIGEIAAYLSDSCFTHLDGPIKRVGSLDTPVPFAETLEENYLPKARIRKTLESLINF
ncbi:MAG: dehydrogenase E1 component subunit alpha/beta [Bacteroidota bacterium]|nr:dehydrogenase E1 component subunit alpha/beta [Bacteroidota bacterium]